MVVGEDDVNLDDLSGLEVFEGFPLTGRGAVDDGVVVAALKKKTDETQTSERRTALGKDEHTCAREYCNQVIRPRAR